ncbi:MAG TPA: PfkB family carbohydrate kinase [Sandaracinaceae bacterium LLY-WYZ-13_1]|nr:PfkB family carbohydrate kinase [Sandaracinaceae bacterium LLY-WYZ-13_1]
MSSMLVVGSVARDTIHNNLGTHPYVLGGSAVFAALSGAHFVQPRLVGIVGTDFPDEEVEMLESKGIDVSGLEVVNGKTFHWEGRYSEDLTSRESIKTELNVFGDFHPKIPDAFRDTPYVMLGNIHPSLQLEVLEQMRDPKLVIADTMNFWIEGTPKELREMMGRIDVFVINEEEARQLAGMHNIVKVAHELLQMGPRIVVIKRGEYGALLFEGDQVFSAPAYPVDLVVDPTGAGDSFAGGMLGFIAREDRVDQSTLRRGIVYGSALASYCVEGTSVKKLQHVTEDQVEERFREFARLAHFATDDELARAAAD